MSSSSVTRLVKPALLPFLLLCAVIAGSAGIVTAAETGCTIAPVGDNQCVQVDPDDISGPMLEIDPKHEGAGFCEGSGSTTVDENTGEECDCNSNAVLTAGNCEIIAALEVGLNILTGAAGLAIVGGIIHGAYLYMTGRDNPGQIAAARSKIIWALVALLILLFFWGFLQWLIPGGLLSASGAPPPITPGGPS